LRPPLIWGKGDPNVLPSIIEAVNKGQMMFIDGGNHHFTTCHVINVCSALVKAEEAQLGGTAYFITDGVQLVFKTFIKDYLATQGVKAPDRSVPLTMAKGVASIMEFIWRSLRLGGQPPLYKGLVNTLGMEFTISDKKARQELGYKPVISIEDGLNQMTS